MSRSSMEPDREFFPLGRHVVYERRIWIVLERTLIAGRPAGRYAYRLIDLAGATTAAIGADLRALDNTDRAFIRIVAGESATMMPRVVLTGEVAGETVQVIECVSPPENPDSPPRRGDLYQAIVGDPDLCPARIHADGRREQGSARSGRIVGVSTDSAEHALDVARRQLSAPVA